MFGMSRSYLRWLTAAAILLIGVAAAFGQSVDPRLFGGLHWRLVGPFRGGRAVAVAGVRNQPEKFYLGAVGGGVWESDNAGRTWTPIFDREPVASIGDIAVAPSDPNVIYVGSGEADMRSDIQQGNGMYKSTDAGKTWTHIGLEDTRQIGKVLIDPKDPDVVYVAALGHQYGPNAERGVFKTTDGGKTWSKILYRNPDVGAIDLALSPTDSNTIYASLWQTRRPPWSVYPPSNGPGSGLFKSTDAGTTWTQIKGGGFPGFVGRVGLSISPSAPNRVYALIDTNDFKDGGVYRTDDAGATWSHMTGDHRLWMRGWYFGGITADPKNSDQVYVMNTSMYRSTNGGKNFTAIKGAPGGDDYHTLWVNPDDPSHMVFGSDQGVEVSVDGARTWSSWYNQPTAQLYHVITDNRFPYWIYGSQQDSGGVGVPSRTVHTGISALDWRPMDAGGESGTIAPDPLHPGVLLSSTGGKESLETAWEQNIDPTLGETDTLWRSEWTMPITASATEPHVYYAAHQKIFRTADDGASWKVISPDLTRKTNSVPPNLDATTAADNDGQPRRGVVYWIAPSPIKPGTIWAGTDDGQIWVTLDEGSHWHDVTPPGLSPWSKIGIIDASHFSPTTAYVAIDRHRVDDNAPYILRTRDGGRHWTRITAGIPAGQFVNVVREDPQRPGLLYAGTDWGVFVSFDDGSHWQSLQLDLPAASVRDIVFNGNDVIVGTHGRSIWVLDDVSPLRQVRSGSSLLKPATACLFQRAGTFGFGTFDEGTPFGPEEPQGENPPWGATLYYAVGKPGKVELTIRDGNGKLIRTFSSSETQPKIDPNGLEIPAHWVKPVEQLTTAPGGHRFVWDLRYRDSGILVPPGRYSVQLKVGTDSFTQPLSVVRDPRLHVSDADLQAQFKMALEVADEVRLVAATQSRGQATLKKHLSPAQRKRLVALLGPPPPEGTPDEGGAAATDIGSLRWISGGLDALAGAVESAPGAPTLGYRRAFAILKAQASQRIAKIKAVSP